MNIHICTGYLDKCILTSFLTDGQGSILLDTISIMATSHSTFA